MQMQAKADDAFLTAAAASAGGRERIMVRRMQACQGESARVVHEWAPFYCAVDAGMLLLFPGPDAVEAEFLKSRCPILILYTNWARALTYQNFCPGQRIGAVGALRLGVRGWRERGERGRARDLSVRCQ